MSNNRSQIGKQSWQIFFARTSNMCFAILVYMWLFEEFQMVKDDKYNIGWT